VWTIKLACNHARLPERTQVLCQLGWIPCAGSRRKATPAEQDHMAVMKMTAEEIKLLRKVLKMSEGEFAERIELKDREAIKLLESGAIKPTLQMNKVLIRLLGTGATRSPKLKKMLEDIKERSQSRWQ
jgi:DNA-binding transcriptional regulator YiaG